MERKPFKSEQPSNFFELITAGGKLNTTLTKYLKMETWTPVMAALLVCGIKARLGCNKIPLGGTGLDDKKLHASDRRFHNARRILADWEDWNEENNPSLLNISPIDFLIWCDEEEIDSDWLRMFRELAGCPAQDAIDLTPSRLALINIQPAPFVDKSRNRAGQAAVEMTQAMKESRSDKEMPRGRRASTQARYDDWQKRADEITKRKPALSASAVAELICTDLQKEKSKNLRSVDAIRQHIKI